jgi:hypothetical protein
MFATFSNENVVQNGLRDLDCSMNFLCALAGGPSPSLVSLWLGGTKQLDDKVTRPLVETIHTLKEIKQIAAPWPLDFHDARLWKQLLADYQANEGKQ